MNYEEKLNILADSFYDENWGVWEQITGKTPTNHTEAETILQNWKDKYFEVE